MIKALTSWDHLIIKVIIFLDWFRFHTNIIWKHCQTILIEEKWLQIPFYKCEYVDMKIFELFIKTLGVPVFQVKPQFDWRTYQAIWGFYLHPTPSIIITLKKKTNRLKWQWNDVTNKWNSYIQLKLLAEESRDILDSWRPIPLSCWHFQSKKKHISWWVCCKIKILLL